MSCCGGGLSAAQVVAQGRALVDGGAAAGMLVKLVYTGDDRRNRPYVAEGKVYFFGANDHRRVNAVPARVLPQFLDPAGRYYGSFERYDPHRAQGAPAPKLGEEPLESGGEPAAVPAPAGKKGGRKDG